MRLTRDARFSSLRRVAIAKSLKNDVKFTKRRSRDADKMRRRTCNRSRAPQRELDRRYKVFADEQKRLARKREKEKAGSGAWRARSIILDGRHVGMHTRPRGKPDAHLVKRNSRAR